MLVKATPGVNFFNLLPAAFMRTDPKCTKKTVKSPVSFWAFGTYGRNSFCKMLVKSTPVGMKSKCQFNKSLLNVFCNKWGQFLSVTLTFYYNWYCRRLFAQLKCSISDIKNFKWSMWHWNYDLIIFAGCVHPFHIANEFAY